MRWAITGGAGFLGRHLARELLASGAAVRALSRRAETDAVLSALGAQPVEDQVLSGSARVVLELLRQHGAQVE